MVQRSHSQNLCLGTAQKYWELRIVVESHMLHSQTIAWRLVQSRFAVEAGGLAMQMILVASVGLRVLNEDRDLDVDPWVVLNRTMSATAIVVANSMKNVSSISNTC